MKPFTIHAALCSLLTLHLASCSSGSAERMAGSSAEAGPCDANLSAAVQGQTDFNACGAYAYTSMGYHAIIGNDDKSWITIGFMTKDRSAVVPGSYIITNGAEVPVGQAFGVNLVYKEGSTDLEHTFPSRNGKLTLTVADGSHYQGSFTVSSTRMKGEKDVRELSGSFDVVFDAARAVGVH